MSEYCDKPEIYMRRMTCSPPDAAATVQGSPKYSNIRGEVRFYQLGNGVLVASEVFGLPAGDGPCGGAVLGMHIHEGAPCTGNAADPFADTGGHYNPNRCLHPYHAGDLPPLFSNHGYAFSEVLTDRFTVRDIVGRSVIIHAGADDFTTQPSGSSGEKIACGVIRG